MDTVSDVPSVPKSTKRINLRNRNTVMTEPPASIQERTRTPRTCKEVAMAKIIQCYAELSLSPKSKRVTQPPSRTPVARRHTEKAPPGSFASRRKSPGKSRRDSSMESSFTPSEGEDESSSEETELEDVISEEELSESSSSDSGSSDVVRFRRRENRRQTTRKVPRTPAADQALVPPRTTAATINRDTLNAKLHASKVLNDCLPCREQEFDTVFEFLFEHLQNRTGGSQRGARWLGVYTFSVKMFHQAIVFGTQSKFCNSFDSWPVGYVGECPCPLLLLRSGFEFVAS
nr:hypothetical transcript [Hymenolepis microstoma]